jgi:hypothetical protein
MSSSIMWLAAPATSTCSGTPTWTGETLTPARRTPATSCLYAPLVTSPARSCLGIIVKRKVPINYFRDKYGCDIKAETDGSNITWLNKMRDSAADVISPIWTFRKSAKTGDN